MTDTTVLAKAQTEQEQQGLDVDGMLHKLNPIADPG